VNKLSVADKLITIANNTPLVCENLGTKKTVSGNPIAVGDVSPAEHNLKINLTSDNITDFSGVKVSRYGKNLFDVEDGVSVYLNGDTGEAIVSGLNVSLRNLIPVCPNTLYTYTTPWENGMRIFYYDSTGAFCKSVPMYAYSKTLVTPDNCYFINICKGSMTPKELKNLQVQMEVGTSFTAYETYKEPQTVYTKIDGIADGLMSLSPNITLLTDTNDVTINCTYRSGENLAANQKIVELKNVFNNAKDILNMSL